MVTLDQHLDEREYELHMTGALMREAEGQEALYDHTFNHNYNYSLLPTSSIVSVIESDTIFFIRLDVGQDIYDVEEAPPAPDVGSEVKVVSTKSNLDDFQGRVGTTQDYILAMRVQRVKGSGTVILGDRTGRFTFWEP